MKDILVSGFFVFVFFAKANSPTPFILNTELTEMLGTTMSTGKYQREMDPDLYY